MTTRPRIVVLDDWERGFARLARWHDLQARADITLHHHALQGPALLDAIHDAQVVVLNRDRTPFTADLIAALPQLRYVVHTGPRNRRLDRQALAQRGIPVSHTDGGPSRESTTELCWSLILGAARQLEAHATRLRAGHWRPEASLPLSPVLQGQRLGLVGLGNIGQRVARLGQAFGMEVVAWSPHMTPARAAAHQVTAVGLDDLLATSLVVSLHLVAAPSTRHLLNAARLATMRPDAILVNTSRAELIDTAALVAALRQGRPGFAALDVFDVEPIDPADPLLALPNVLLSPHLGFVSEPSWQQFVHDVTESLTAWLDGTPLPRLLPPE